MPAFVIEGFGGAIPIMGKRLLANNFAQRAVNVDLLSGEMRGIPNMTEIHDFGSGTYQKATRIPQKGSVPGDKWIGFASKYGGAIPYAISNDAFLRHVLIDNNSPGNPVTLRYNTQQRIYDGNASYILGLPKPVAAPLLNVTGGSGATETRSYVYTFVDAFGQEGPPSDPVTVTGYTNGSWDLSGMDTSVSSSSDRPTITKRIYRTVFANSGIATFREVVDNIAIGTATYSDTIANTVVALSTQLEATSWFPPEGVEGVVSAPGGFLVGWSDKTLFFSEPYRPWAWPPEYAIAVPHTILGCAYIDQTLVVVTESSPVFITGSTPSALAVAKTEAVEAGVSSPSIVSAIDGVYFATRAGLVRVSAAGMQNVTEKLISEHDWEADYGENILSAARYQTKYIGMTAAGAGFMIDWRDQRVAFTELLTTIPFSVIWVDDYTGELHALAGTKIYLWGDQDAGRQNCLWKSKEFVVARPVNLGCAVVEMDLGPDTEKEWGVQAGDGFEDEDDPIGGEQTANASVGGWTVGEFMLNQQGVVNVPEVDFEASLELPSGVDAWMILYANGRRIWQWPIYNNRLIRFPSGYKSTSYEISIVTSLTIYSIRMATHPKELANA
jgi:hypothetical protein